MHGSTSEIFSCTYITTETNLQYSKWYVIIYTGFIHLYYDVHATNVSGKIPLPNNIYWQIQWRTVVFWRPGQEVESAPLFLNFFFPQKNSKMVDPKLNFSHFQKWKAKKKKKKKKSYIFPKFEVWKVYTGLRYTTPRAYKLIKLFP